MAEEKKEGGGDGEDRAALAGGGGPQERTQGRSESRGCAGSQQKTDCGHKLPRSKPHKGDEKSRGDWSTKGARKGSDMGGVLGSRGVHGFRAGLSEARSLQRGRWTRDSPGILALSHHNLLPLDLDLDFNPSLSKLLSVSKQIANVDPSSSTLWLDL